MSSGKATPYDKNQDQRFRNENSDLQEQLNAEAQARIDADQQLSERVTTLEENPTSSGLSVNKTMAFIAAM
jgi:hypothetical protein